MQIVIDIPEDVKIAITRMGLLRISDEMQNKVDKAIQHGTPIPKGHGRLIDADEFIKAEKEWLCKDCKRLQGMKNGKWKFIYEIGDAPCRACYNMDMFEYIDEAPTVLEADRED